MKRVLFALAVSVVSIGLMGCATNVEEPVPPTPAPEPQRDPPKQVFSAPVQNPEAALIGQMGIYDGVSAVPAKQRPPLPSPIIETP
jgi:xanthosine utilization system XapX-like protein